MAAWQYTEIFIPILTMVAGSTQMLPEQFIFVIPENKDIK
jgi:hypothetical protein